MSARSVWERLTGVTTSFGTSGRATVVVAPSSKLCPPSWTGVAVLGNGALVTVPSELDRQRFLSATAEISPTLFAQPDIIQKALPVVDILGPGHLSYTSHDYFRPARATTAHSVESVSVDHIDVRHLVESVSPEEAEESAIAAITSPVFIVRRNGSVVAAAGYTVWAELAAHICVLTAPNHRNQGFARLAASAAVEHAMSADLVPQWRARPMASRRVARAIGFQELGTQLSFRTTPPEQVNESPASP